jgi:hypothetical protein
MSRCPLCAGTGTLAAELVESNITELPASTSTVWDASGKQTLRQLLHVLHQCVLDDDARRAENRRAQAQQNRRGNGGRFTPPTSGPDPAAARRPMRT